MENKVINVELILKSAEAAASVKDVRTALKDIKTAMLTVGEDSKEFNKLAGAAAELKDRVGDAAKAIDHMNPDKFNALGSAAKVASTGLELTTGAMAMLGGESKDTQAALLKVQETMMFAQGLQGIGEAKKELMNLWKEALKNPLQAVLIAAVAIGGAIYAAYQSYQEAHSEATRLKEVAEETKKVNDQQVVVADNQLRLMQAQGANAFEIHKKEQEILALKIKIAEADVAAANAVALQAANMDTVWEKTQMALAAVAPKWQSDLIEAGIQDQKLKRIEEAKKAAVDANNILEGLKTDALVSDAKYTAVVVANSQKIKEEKIKNAQEADDWQKKADDEMIANWLADEKIKDDAIDAAKARDAKILSDHQKYLDYKHQQEKKYHDQEKLDDEKAAKLKQMLSTQAMTGAASLFGSLSELSKKNSKEQKAFAIAQALINTYKGVSSALAQPTPFPLNLLMAAAAAAAGMVQVKNIMAVNEQGTSSSASGGTDLGGSVSISSPQPALNPAQQPSTMLNDNGTVQHNQNPIYVSVQEINNVNSNVTAIENLSRH